MEYTKEEINVIKEKIEPYKNFYLTNNEKPFLHLFITILGIFISIFLIKKSPYFIPLLSLFIARTFMIFHDCCHNSFLKISENQHNNGETGWNKFVAKIIETICGYDCNTWSKIHSYHHKIHGNANFVDETKTVINLDEYEQFPYYKKLAYRVFRSPIIFFFILPIYVFYLQHLIKPLFTIKVLAFYFLIYIFGKFNLVKRVLISHYIAGIIGIMLFHLQHQVNTGYYKKYDKTDTFTHDKAQLHGASMLQIPWFLKWTTFGIEYHHIHHLTPRIPSYNLQSCHEDNEQLFNKITKVGYLQAFKSLFHTLYDEKREKYISFPIHAYLGLQH